MGYALVWRGLGWDGGWVVGGDTPGRTMHGNLEWTTPPSPSVIIINRATPGVLFLLLVVQGRAERTVGVGVSGGGGGSGF